MNDDIAVALIRYADAVEDRVLAKLSHDGELIARTQGTVVVASSELARLIIKATKVRP